MSKLQNVFVQIAKCICPNCKIYLSHWKAGLLLFASLNRRHSESKLLFSFKSFQEKIRWELKADVGARDDAWLSSLEFAATILTDTISTHCLLEPELDHPFQHVPPTAFYLSVKLVQNLHFMERGFISAEINNVIAKLSHCIACLAYNLVNWRILLLSEFVENLHLSWLRVGQVQWQCWN